MRADAGAIAFACVLLTIALPATTTRAARLTPALNVMAGWNDNVNVRSDEDTIREKPQADSVWLLRPSVRYDARPIPQLGVELKHHTKWEQYSSVTTGNSFTHIGDVSVRAPSTTPGIRIAVGYRLKDYKNLRDAAGRQHLDCRAGRAAASLDLPIQRSERYTITAGYVLLFKKYPQSEVMTDPAAGGASRPRRELSHTGSVGFNVSLADSIVCSVQYQNGDNNGNAIELQHGEYRDYYSYRRHGATIAVAGSTGAQILWNTALHYQRRSFDERTVPDLPRRERTASTALSTRVSWIYSASITFVVEHSYFRHVSDNELFSFDNHQLTAGLKLSNRLDL